MITLLPLISKALPNKLRLLILVQMVLGLYAQICATDDFVVLLLSSQHFTFLTTSIYFCAKNAMNDCLFASLFLCLESRLGLELKNKSLLRDTSRGVP